MKAVMIIVITYFQSSVTSERIEFPTLTDCRIARLQLPEIDAYGLWRDAICIEVPE